MPRPAGSKGFTMDFGTPVDFVKVNGNLYPGAWRVLTEFVGD